MENLTKNELLKIVKFLLNERELAKIYLNEFENGFLNKKLTKKAYIETLNRLYANSENIQGL